MSASASQGRDSGSSTGWDKTGSNLAVEVILLLLGNWIFYFLYLTLVLVVSRCIRYRNKTNDYNYGKGPAETEGTTNTTESTVNGGGGIEDAALDLDPLSLTFTDTTTHRAYQRYVREEILPPVNKFMALIMFLLGIVKLTRLLDNEEPLNGSMFKPIPRLDIINNASTSLHVSFFFFGLVFYETDRSREKRKCCRRDKAWSKFLETIEVTKFLLFFGPFMFIMPGIYLCISDGNALLSSQCQHLHWASQVKHRLFDDRMNPAFKTFLNDPKFMWDAKAQESDLFNQIVSAYKKNTSSAAVGAGFSDWLHAMDLQGGEDTARYLSYVKYKVVEGQYVELSLRPWTYGRDIEMAALYSFALLLAYVLVQMATYDCGCFMPCSKRNKKPRRMGFMFFVSLNLYSFSWAILYHISIPWSTATEIFFRPILYWFCFIIFVYIIERTRREAWSRSEEIRRHLRDKSRLHQHYLEQQNQFVADLAHNYGNMSSTIAVCWTDVADAHAYVLMQDDKPSKEALAAVNESILKAKALSEMTQTVVMASVRTLRGHFQCKASRVDLFDTIKWIPYLTSNYKRYKVEIKENVPQNIMVDYAVLLTSLSNFASNAQKYSSGEILIIASYLDGVVRLEVIDRGGGVPRDKQAVIFERGEQSRLQKGKMGQGIGLHSVATIVSKSVGGRLGIISPFFKDADSPGSCFWFELIDQGYGSIESKAGVAPTMHSSFTSFGERCIGQKPKTGGPAVQILLVEDNLLMQLAIKTKLGRYFQSMSIGCNFTCIPADKPDTMGEMALACLKSPTAMFDVVFLDQQLGVRQEGSSCLWGTDVIQKYAQWLEQSGGTKAEDLGDWRYEDQIIHILSAAGSGADILKNAGVEETYPWLQPCPFSKPIQERELQQFNVMEYPHFRRCALEAMSAPDAQDETSEGMVELMETKETKEKAEGGAFENRKILTRKEGKQVVQSKRDDG